MLMTTSRPLGFLAAFAASIFAAGCSADTVDSNDPGAAEGQAESTSQAVTVSFVARAKLKNNQTGLCVTPKYFAPEPPWPTGYYAGLASCADAYAFDIYTDGSKYSICQQGSKSFCYRPVWVEPDPWQFDTVIFAKEGTSFDWTYRTTGEISNNKMKWLADKKEGFVFLHTGSTHTWSLLK